MSKKDYKMLAEAFSTTKPSVNWPNKYQQWTCDVRKIADSLQEDNIRFDRKKFYAACGFDE